MRVTQNSFSEDLIGRLGSLTSRQSRLQTEAASGQRILSLADDPAAMGRLLNLEDESTAVAQYRNNIQTAQQVSQANFTVIQSLKKISDRAGEIATLADGLKSPEEMTVYA